jgi:hypothetical protein
VHTRVKISDKNHKMQKFVIKKISRSTNITISSNEEQNLSQCSDQVQLKPPPDDSSHLDNPILSSVKMCGYLKKKRNVSENGTCHLNIVVW